APFNLADPLNGGHVAWTDPQAPSPDFAKDIVSADPTRRTLALDGGVAQWAIGFRDDRAARITELQWVDPDGSTPDARFTDVSLDVSLESPAGPWRPIGLWTLTRAADGGVAPFKLDQPTWARFIRVTGRGPSGQSTAVEYPATIRIFEQATDDSYRSILGEWGQGNLAGIYERLSPPAPPSAAEADHNDTPETAQRLPLDQPARGAVQIDRDVDWYRIDVPPGRNTLTFTVDGDPTVGVVVTLQDAAGAEVPLRSTADADPQRAELTATVTPGASYRLKVAQPPHSVVFAFDTSISLANYDPFVREALASFAAGVTAGQEVVNLLPFGGPFALHDWSDQPYEVQSALNGLTAPSLSSAAETTMIDATNALAPRPGAKAIVVITDADTSSYAKGAELWRALAAAQPRLFTVQVGTASDPAMQQQLMQDWSTVGAGAYEYATTHGAMDRAFDRASAWLRRPAGYTLTVAAGFTAPATPVATATATPTPIPTVAPTATPAPTATATATPSPTAAPPGSVAVVAPAPGSAASQPPLAAGVAVELILDTSGSMLQDIEPDRSKADVAKATLTDLTTTVLPAGTPLTLRVFGTEPGSCDTSLAIPLQPLDPAVVAQHISDIQVVNEVKTPLGASLAQVANDLRDAPGPKLVVLVTDGEETCGGDPEQAIKDLAAQGIDVHVNIVGFALDDPALKRQFEQWAQAGNGQYIDAGNADELAAAVRQAVAAPFRLLDASGAVVATGVVGGPPVDVSPGTYTVELLTDPARRYPDVVVASDQTTTVRIEADAG
ncbi:MAG TPA: VWA domain-containing protein, partial [Thermomicrobiales bacterium]|nr:VWA domain-containing protein [Thermomicrobiales bacterium]